MSDINNMNSGFGGALKPGKRPALLVIDFQLGFTDREISPLASDCSKHIKHTNEVIKHMRTKGPVIFSICGYSVNMLDSGIWSHKCPTLSTLIRGTPACQLDPRLDFNTDSDIIIEKTQASAFFGTPLSGLLNTRHIDMLLIAGCTTSGCVRASVVDALQNGFSPFVIKDACGDRSNKQHESNLIDMQDKYAEVIDTKTAISYIKQCSN